MRIDESRNGLEEAAGVIPAEPRDFKEEREELQRVLSHPEISRSHSLVRFLSYICQKYFDGEAADIREYTIAVEALGRKGSSFNSHADPIVRVTARSLRKKLWHIYETDEQNQPLRILLPLGHYVPQFERFTTVSVATAVLPDESESHSVKTESPGPAATIAAEITAPAIPLSPERPDLPGTRNRLIGQLVIGGVVVLAVFFAGYYFGQRAQRSTLSPTQAIQSNSESADSAVQLPDPEKEATIPAPSIQWRPVPIRAGSSVASVVTLHAEKNSGRVNLTCVTQPATTVCVLAKPAVDFTGTLAQEDSLTISTDSITDKGHIVALPGVYKMTITATTLSGNRSQLTVPFEVRSAD